MASRALDISIRQVAYFMALVERGSFTAAAQALGITQPALSIAIGQLERTLGAVLLQRGSSPLALTEEGEIFRRYAVRVQRDLAEARDELAAFGAGAIGRLSLCMGPSAATREVGAVLTGIAAENPGLAISVVTGVLPAVAERLLEGEFPLYLGTVPDGFADPRLSITPLAPISLVIVAAPSHPLARQAGVTVAQLSAAAWMAIGDVDANLPAWSPLFSEAGMRPPRPAINVRNIAVVRSLLHQGHFLTILPLSMAQPDLEAGQLVRIGAERFSWQLSLCAISRAGAPLPAAARLFFNRLVRAFSPGA